MSFPVIPVLNGTFDSSTQYQVRKVSDRFNDRFESIGYDGLNRITNIRNISEFVVGYSNKATLENFLKTQKNKPFFYNPFLDATETGTLYVCFEWSFQKVSPDTWNFKASFKQVYRSVPL